MLFPMSIDFDSYPLLDMFRGLDQEALDGMKICHFERGDYVIRADRVLNVPLYLILSGMCIRKTTDDMETLRILPGEFIGLQIVIAPERVTKSVDIIAKTPVEALVIKAENYRAWQMRYPKLYNDVISRVLDRQFGMRDLTRRCALLDSVSAGAFYLAYLYSAYLNVYHERGYFGEVRIWDTRREIGEAIACDVRSVDRMIQALRNLNLITIRNTKIYIDAAQAKQLGEYAERNQ